MKNLDYSICKFIQEQDRNSDIMEAWEEYCDQELDHWTLTEILQDILSAWKEDFILGDSMTPRIQGYYNYLGI